MSSLEALGLYVVVTKPDGTVYRWDGGYRAEDTPTNIQFGSKRNTGFDTMSCVLPRPLDRDFPDLELFDDIAVKALSGDSRWEGRVVQISRSATVEGDTIQVDAVGWMAHAQDQKQPMLYLSQDLSAWKGPDSARQFAIIGASAMPVAPEQDTQAGNPSLKCEIEADWVLAARPIAEGWLDVGDGNSVASLYYGWVKSATVDHTNLSWSWSASLSTDLVLTTTNSTANLRAAGPGTGTLTASGAAKRYVKVHLDFGLANIGTQGTKYQMFWTVLAVYGALSTGLTKRGTASQAEAQGFYASDLLKDMVARFCPRLNTAGVQDTFLTIPQANWPTPTTVYDAALILNGYHLWELAVWEDHTLHWGPLDLTDWDWEVRRDDPGVEIELQGDSAGDLVNAAIVHYDQLPGRRKATVFPADDPALIDTSADNPVNRHNLGLRPVEVTPSFPTSQAVAVQIGRIALAEAQQAKRPGTITVGGGYIRDRQGNMRPSSMVRSGQRIKITDIPGDVTRPIGEARYDDASKKLTIGVESSIERLEAFYNRVDVNLSARGLGS